jgi:hypothetical protein
MGKGGKACKIQIPRGHEDSNPLPGKFQVILVEELA